MIFAVVVRPYPFERWPRMQRDDLPRIARWARTLPVQTKADAREDLSAWLGVDVKARSRSLRVCPAGGLHDALAEPLAAVVLRSDSGTVVVELSPELATATADRILGGEGIASDTVLSDVERGALAYAAARLSESGWSVVGVVTTIAAMVHALGDDGSVVCGWDLELGVTGGVVRVWVPPTTSPLGGRSLPALPNLSLDVVLDAGSSTLAGSELVRLERGDVVLLDEVWWPRRTAGHVVGSERTRWWCDSTGRCESIETGLCEAPQEGTRAMQDEGITETMDRIGDAPVFITVELARFRMSVKELAKVRPGEVLGTGTPLGERVALRVGDKIVARGELVDIEGEVGVQITELAPG